MCMHLKRDHIRTLKDLAACTGRKNKHVKRSDFIRLVAVVVVLFVCFVVLFFFFFFGGRGEGGTHF